MTGRDPGQGDSFETKRDAGTIIPPTTIYSTYALVGSANDSATRTQSRY
jgi:hypothetical protein